MKPPRHPRPVVVGLPARVLVLALALALAVPSPGQAQAGRAAGATTDTPRARPGSADAVRARLNPDARATRTLTSFTPALRCMDDMLYASGIRDITMMMEEMRDATMRVPISVRDMMTSAISDMTRRSRAIRLSMFGSDQQNAASLLTQAHRQGAFSIVPQYTLRGTVSQMDEGVDRRASSLAITSASELFGLKLGSDTRFSVLAFDAALIDTERLTLVPGVSSRNSTLLVSRNASAGEGSAQLKNPAMSVVFTFSPSRSEGPSQAARNMVELAAVELVGKLVRLPYWQCLGIADDEPEVQRETEDWFLSMDPTELRAFLQLRMRERGRYPGPTDGNGNPAFSEALAAYRPLIGLPPEGPLDLDFFRRFVVTGVPRLSPSVPAPVAAAGNPSASRSVGPAASRPPEPSAGSASTSPDRASAVLRMSSLREASLDGPLQIAVVADQPGHLYCYARNPASGNLLRIFPNRYTRDSRLEAGRSLTMPGGDRFRLDPEADYACLLTHREVYPDLPQSLRWGDFEDMTVRSFEAVRELFQAAAGAPVGYARFARACGNSCAGNDTPLRP
ncbi:MAG: DUF4384 domain-containing protein [Betaproteobacteria bacterium]|nr:DUF4384 domain-containing protein [Betaproteobacteria bacterium]